MFYSKYCPEQRVRIIQGHKEKHLIGKIATIIAVSDTIHDNMACYVLDITNKFVFVEDTLKLMPRKSKDVEDTLQTTRHVKNDIVLTEWIKNISPLKENMR